MLFIEILRVAMDAIRAHKLRSFLTMLGIVIGVGAVITMVAMGEGAQRAVEEQIARLGTNVLTVQPGLGDFHGVRSGEARLTVDDVEAVRRGSPSIEALAPQMQRSYQVKYRRANANTRIIGTTPNFPRVNNWDVEIGRFFTEAENSGRRRVAVLGSAVPEELGVTAAEVLGRPISIRNITFEVVGVLKEKGSTGWYNEDNQIWVPLNTAQFRLMGTDWVNSFKVAIGPHATKAGAMVEIETVLRRQHRLGMGKENDFRIRDYAALLGTREETTKTFGMLLAGIAAVSLLVGGIGIMNIMLVSVTERTREIGVRKALGATRRAVLLQFLLEATTLCLVGGLFGLLFGFGTAAAMSAWANFNTAVSPRAALLAIVFSAAVGLFFGMWPARRAARLDPIVALRYE
ncbi:MAG: ABC transporter permease [Gemmatimonadota bacterium]